MFKAVQFNPPINEDDIEIAKQKLKDILGLSAEQNDFDDISSESDNDEYEADGEEYYVVEKVFNHCIEDGEQKFEVKWNGYDDLTWEPLENFVTQGSKMAVYLYFKGRWERKQERMSAKSQASGAATNINVEKERMNRAVKPSDASTSLNVEKERMNRAVKPSDASTSLNVEKKRINRAVEPSGASTSLNVEKERISRAVEPSGASTNLNVEKERINRAIEPSDASVDPVKRNKESQLEKSSSAAHIVLDKPKEAIKKGHENSRPFKKDNVNAEFSKTTAGKETKSNVFNMDTKKAYDVRSNQEYDQKFKRSGEKRKAGIHNDSKNLKQFKSSSTAPKFSRSSVDDLKSKMDTQRRQIKEYTERRKKEKAEEERLRREAKAEEKFDLEEYRKMIAKLKNDLGSSDDEEFCTEAN